MTHLGLIELLKTQTYLFQTEMSSAENFHYNMNIRNLLLTAILYFVMLEPSFHYDKCYYNPVFTLANVLPET